MHDTYSERIQQLNNRMITLAGIVLLALLGLEAVGGFGLNPYGSYANRGEIRKLSARGYGKAPTGHTLKERSTTTNIFRKVFANAGILTGIFLPGKAAAAQRVEAAVVAKENTARQNPRDVWSGGKRRIESEKLSSASSAKIPLYNSRVDKASATGTFVS